MSLKLLYIASVNNVLKVSKDGTPLRISNIVGRRWIIGRVYTCQPEGRGFESLSSRHIGTLGKSSTHSCLWHFGVKLRHSICDVSGALLSRRGAIEMV